MSPLWDVAATTGMGGGGGAAALVLFGHRKYVTNPTRRRPHSDSQSQRRWDRGRAWTVSGGIVGLSGICENWHKCTHEECRNCTWPCGICGNLTSQILDVGERASSRVVCQIPARM